VWSARVAAAHTIPREADAEESYGVDLSRFGELKVPVLLMLGGDSPGYFREAVEMLHSSIPNSRVHVMRGQRHVAMDTAPEQFIEAIVAFALSEADPNEISA
jgi:pimeloyl-ACP methyl ester carboxylesterase